MTCFFKMNFCLNRIEITPSWILNRWNERHWHERIEFSKRIHFYLRSRRTTRWNEEIFQKTNQCLRDLFNYWCYSLLCFVKFWSTDDKQFSFRWKFKYRSILVRPRNVIVSNWWKISVKLISSSIDEVFFSFGCKISYVAWISVVSKARKWGIFPSSMPCLINWIVRLN